MDIMNCKQKGSIVEVTGIWDDQETALYEQMEQLPLSPANSPINRQLITMLFTPCLPLDIFTFNNRLIFNQLFYPILPGIPPTQGYIGILLPPPRKMMTA